MRDLASRHALHVAAGAQPAPPDSMCACAQGSDLDVSRPEQPCPCCLLCCQQPLVCASCRTTQFFYEGEFLEDKYTRPWFFSWTFCIAACTIISGCLAERTALAAYPAATLLIAAIVHPLLVHWIWNPQVSPGGR